MYPRKTATIAINEQTSTAVDIEGMVTIGLEMPSAFTGTSMTFLGSSEAGGTFQDIYKDDGTQVSITVANSRNVSLDSVIAALSPWRYIKLKSGSAEGAARTIYVVGK